MILWEKALEFLVSTIGEAAVDSWHESSDVYNDIFNLRTALPKAQLLIERAECWRLPKYNPIDKLLSLLKDSVYEAESILDEFLYQSLKHKIEKNFPGTENFQKWIKNWMSKFPTIVKRVLDRLNNVYNEMKESCDSRGIPQNPNQFCQTARPITSTFLEIPKVYGRDKEYNDVIRRMGVPSSGSGKRKRAKRVSVSNLEIGESSSRMDKKQNVSVLSIVGMGGVGKTTLAQLVCNDKSVMHYFDLIMWVCVSDNFDKVTLTKQIVESATKKECNLTNLHALQVNLQETLNSKRFLLVLDDVWSKDWQCLLAPMEGASEGSVALVTTRSPECVEISGTSLGSRGVINLEGLEEHIYWEFFKSCAFGSVAESNNINPELEVIGKEICKRLKGSPLAAITIGGALKNNSGVEHWTNIKDSKMWELQKEEHDILPVLQLSYQYLPSYLKKCFSFCSLYPKDFKFTQSELTEFWIMQGFIEPQDNDRKLRTLANDYFVDFVRRGFFQTLASGANYVIHDLMHDVCLSITKDECFCLENGHSEQKISLDIRHASVFQKKVFLKEQKELCKYKKLLSLKVGPNSCSITGIETWCNELKNIRSLSLARCKIKKLPENIGNLKHLQFLDISGTNVETLPESFCNLYNLQFLNMNNCSKIEYFPEGFYNLVNLQLFYLPFEKVSLVERFENIVKAIKLHYLELKLGGNMKIEILKNICKLSGSLDLCALEHVPSKEAAQKAQLNNKPFINCLGLEWTRHDLTNDHEDHDKEVLDGLCPHHNLKELKISSYRGRNLSPSWLKEEFLPNLTEVEFRSCEKVSTISHLPRCITKLVIKDCCQLENLQGWLEPYHLPALKHFEVQRCNNLETLQVESFGGFESLEQLIITSCPKLRCPNAMVLPPSVKGLELGDCGDLEKSIPSCLQNLPSLQTLDIHDCQHLVSIPAEVTSNLKSLSKLTLGSCDKLQSLGGLQFLASLQRVSISDCPKLHETRGRNIKGKLPSERFENIVKAIKLYNLKLFLQDEKIEILKNIGKLSGSLLDAGTTLPSYSSGCQENHLEYDPQKNRELFVKMVIDNKSMLEHVENPFLEKFARSLQPSYSHVTRRDVEEDCLTFYKNEKAQLKEKLTKLTSKVSLSVAWCYSPKTQSQFLCVATHFIDNDFKLFKRIIGFVEFDARVGFDNERILNDWGLSKKAFACTAIDGDIRCVNKSSRILVVKCILECFRSIAYEIYNEIGPDIYYIERMMEDLNEFPEKMCYFNQIAGEHNLAPKFEFLLNNKGVLGFDLNTLNDACTYKNVLGALDDMHVEWSKVEEVVHLLNPINDAVVMLSSLEFPTSNLLLKFIFEISDFLSKASPVFSGTKQAIHKSLAQLDEYLASCNYIVLIASLLDPRFKLRFQKCCIGKFIAKEEDFNKFCCSFYNEYQTESTEIYQFDYLSQIPELNKYLEHWVEEGDVNFDVLGWWKDSESEYPILSRMARDILAIPISSSLTSGTEPVEEIIKEIFRSTVDTGMSKVLVCCNNWLRSGHIAGKSVAGIENIIEKRHLDQAFSEHSNKSNSCVYDQIKCQELLAKLVVSCELPFHFVKCTWFIEWAKNLQPLYTPVDLAFIKTKCLGFYQIERQRFKDLYKNTFVNSAHRERVCFSAHRVLEFPTTYICVTAHSIDNDFKLVRRIIGIKIKTYWDHQNTRAITAQVQRCIDHWELPKKVLAFTTEIFWNEYNDEKLLDGLTCGFGAIKLHCVVQGLFNGLLSFIWDELHQVFGSIRKMIKFFAEDPNAMHTINQHGIKLDDERRWDSTVNMLSDALAYKDVFDAYKGYDESFPLCENWNEVENAVKLLKPIYEAVTILSSSQYPTSNLLLKIVFEIYDVLSHVVFNTNNDYDKGKFLDCLMKISDSYLKGCNNILLVASLLDPRFKSTYLERCYTEHISDREEIIKCIGDLCIEFEIKHDREMSELKIYLQEDRVEVRDDDFDVLTWWKVNQSSYPMLSNIARQILAIPVSSLSSESAFSTAFFWGDSKFIRFGKLANKLGPRILEALMCSYNWLSDASNNGKCVQEGAAIDWVEKHIPPSYKCPLRACDIWSVSFLKRGLSGRMSEEIVAIGGARLTAEKMLCLIQPIDKDEIDRWIPDEVINCYIHIMNNQGSTSGKILKLSTFDSQLLQSWGSSMDEREKLVEKGNGFLQNELVFLPIQVQSHWFVGVLNVPKKEFQILNSLNSLGRPFEETTHKLRLGIQVCIDAALDSQGVPLEWMLENVLNWPLSVISNLPQQKDGCSCGLFALKYMQLWDGSKLATEFTQDDIDLFRKQLVGELIFSELNEMKDIQNEIKKRKLFTEESVGSEELEESDE